MLRILIGTAMVMAAFGVPSIRARADDGELCSYVSLNSGKAFVSVITAEAVERTPRWNTSSPCPPLSAQKAMQLADKMKDELLDPRTDERWVRVAIELRQATDDHWYWLARYELDPDGWSGPLPDLIILVLMDGTVVTPRVYPERKYRTVLQGPLNETETFLVQGKTLTDAGLAQLQGMSSLSSITLNSLVVTDAGLEHIGGLVQLKGLSVSSPKVGDPGLEHLRDLTQLESLILESPQITDAGLMHLAGLSKLQYLYLGNCAVTGGGCEHLKRLDNLQDLTITCARIQGAGLEFLRSVSQLKSLDLEGNPLDDAGLMHLRGLVQLQVLNLNGTRVTDAGLQHLTELKQLARLYLQDTAVTEEGLKMFKKALPDCDVFR